MSTPATSAAGPETPAPPRIGFVGLGVMGQPMALNLIRAGAPLVVWNRTPERCVPLGDAGAVVASGVDEVFDAAGTVILMLVDEAVTDTVLGRGTSAFDRRVEGRLVISTGSVAPRYSQELARDVHAAGGRFVESPVSGSRGPAESGTLVALVAGAAEDVREARAVLAPMTRHVVSCGEIGSGLLMKLAVNHYLNVMVAALAEAMCFADAHGLDRRLLESALMAGPMASALLETKLDQLVHHDFEVRAAASDALASTRLIAEAARAAGLVTPLLDLASELYAETVHQGNGRRDMVAVIDSIRARSAT